MALDEPKGSDTFFEEGAIKYIVESELMDKTGDITIDFVEAGYQSGFSIISAKPVAAASCSVGGSCSC